MFVILAVSYIFTGFTGYLMSSKINYDVCKLAQTSWVKEKRESRRIMWYWNVALCFRSDLFFYIRINIRSLLIFLVKR
jgi:hypothetical protein